MAQSNIFWMIMMIEFTIIAIVWIGMYIFQSLGLYAIAKRRGMQYPGLAWVPVVQMYIQGGITDDYNQRFENKKTHYKHILLWLGAGYSVMYIIYLANYMQLITSIFTGYNSGDFRILFSLLAVSLLFSAVGITYLVFKFIALHKLYKSCTKNYVVLLVLSIIFNVVEPFAIFAIRNNDIYPEMPMNNINI